MMARLCLRLALCLLNLFQRRHKKHKQRDHSGSRDQGSWLRGAGSPDCTGWYETAAQHKETGSSGGFDWGRSVD